MQHIANIITNKAKAERRQQLQQQLNYIIKIIFITLTHTHKYTIYIKNLFAKFTSHTQTHTHTYSHRYTLSRRLLLCVELISINICASILKLVSNKININYYSAHTLLCVTVYVAIYLYIYTCLCVLYICVCMYSNKGKRNNDNILPVD